MVAKSSAGQLVSTGLGFHQVKDVGTAGMIAVKSGGLFARAVLASPETAAGLQWRQIDN